MKAKSLQANLLFNIGFPNAKFEPKGSCWHPIFFYEERESVRYILWKLWTESNGVCIQMPTEFGHTIMTSPNGTNNHFPYFRQKKS